MGRHKKGSGSVRDYADKRRKDAKRLYIQRLGSITDSEIARMLGVARQTVGKWHKADGWNDDLVKAKDAAAKATAQAAATAASSETVQALTSLLQKEIEDSLQNMRLVNALVRKKLFKHDAAGRPIKDVEGRNQLNDSLSTVQLGSLVRTLGECFKNFRLATGQSTENTGINAKLSGGTAPRSGEDHAFVEKLEQTLGDIAKGNSAEAQTKLLAMVHAFPPLNAAEGGGANG